MHCTPAVIGVDHLTVFLIDVEGFFLMCRASASQLGHSEKVSYAICAFFIEFEFHEGHVRLRGSCAETRLTLRFKTDRRTKKKFDFVLG